MAVVTIGNNRFPTTSQLSEYYIQRRFATEEIYNRYIEDIANLISVAVPEYQNYKISDEMKTLLNQKVEELEVKLEEVSALYSISDNLNYKNAEKEVAELNKIIQDTLASIREEIDNLNYKEFDYYLRQKLIEVYSTKAKKVVSILTDNQKILTKNGAIVILGKDGYLYGIGNNKSGVLGEVCDEYQKSIKRIDSDSKIKDFTLFEDKILIIDETGKIWINNPESFIYKSVNNEDYDKILYTNEASEKDSKTTTFVALVSDNSTVSIFDGEKISQKFEIPTIDTASLVYEYNGKVYVFGIRDEYYEYDENTKVLTIRNPRSESSITDNIGSLLPKIIPDISILVNEVGSNYILDNTKNLFVCGNNTYGQLGLGIDDIRIDSYRRVEKFKNSVNSILSSGDRAYLISSKKVYDYKNSESDSYRNQDVVEDDSSLWVAGRNEPNDPLIGIPTSIDLKKLENRLDDIDMMFFEDESLAITDEIQEEINNLLVSKASVSGKAIAAKRKYSGNIREWTKVFPGEETNYLISDIIDEIETVYSEYERIKSEILA